MRVPHITSFCWCMGLELGSILIGVVHLAISLAILVLSIVFAVNAHGFVGTVEDGEDHLYTAWFIITAVVAIISVVHVALALTLLIAIQRRHTVALRVWVYVMCVLVAAALLYVLAAAVRGGFSTSGSDIFVAFLEGVVFFGVLGYSIICVHSYYLKVKSAEDMEGPNKNNY